MSDQLTWWGHSCWLLELGGQRLVIDPFLSQNPAAPVQPGDVHCDALLITHGHADHIGDCVEIAQRTGVPVLAVFEIAEWLSKHKVKETIGMNLGGTISVGELQIKMVPAQHSSALPDGTYGGVAAGFVISHGDRRIYFAGDTSLMMDMQWIGEMGLEAAVLPIGDLYTMGPEDSVQAVRWLKPQFVLPTHYNTWPPIAQNTQRWESLIRTQTAAQPIVLAPGESWVL